MEAMCVKERGGRMHMARNKDGQERGGAHQTYPNHMTMIGDPHIQATHSQERKPHTL